MEASITTLQSAMAGCFGIAPLDEKLILDEPRRRVDQIEKRLDTLDTEIRITTTTASRRSAF